MVITRRIEHLDDDVVVVKQAQTDGDVARLTHEAAVLVRCRHPGVVELVDVDDRAIRLRHAGSSLTRCGPFPLDHVVGIMSTLADIVDAVHRTGIAHQNIDMEHVLIGRGGHPTLCGFGRAVDATDESMAEDVGALGHLLRSLLHTSDGLPWARPVQGFGARTVRRQARKDLEALAATASHPDHRRRPSARQFAKAVHTAVPEPGLPDLGAVHTTVPAPDLYAELPEDVDPTSDLRWTDEDLTFLAHQHELERDVFDNAAFGASAFTASVFDEAPTADPYEALSDLAGGEGGAGGESEQPAGDFWDRSALRNEPGGPELPEPTPGSGGRVAEPVRARIEIDFTPPARSNLPDASVVLPPPRDRDDDTEPPERRWVLPVVLAVVLVLSAIGGAAGARSLTENDATPPVTLAAPATTTPPTPPTWPATCSIPVPTGPDVDADGCPEAIEALGRVVTLGSVTVELGEHGDLVTFGDWTCDGVDTPALLRPETGEVFVFETWSLDAPATVVATAIVDGAEEIRTGADTCPRPLVSGPDGEVAIPLG